MPGYKGHLVGGTVAGALVWSGLWLVGHAPSVPQTALLFSLLLLGALFPDVDTDSRGQHLFYLNLAVLDVALIVRGHYAWAAVLGLVAMLPALGPHRGWTHTWWAMLLVPLPILALPLWMFEVAPSVLMPYYVAVVVGYGSHLLLDGTW
ncbi:metal-dependent hydrolase [Desulfovibrionales bacterium]